MVTPADGAEKARGNLFDKAPAEAPPAGLGLPSAPQPIIEEAKNIKSEEAERADFSNQSFKQLTDGWFARLKSSETAYRQQEEGLINYEMQIYNALANIEQLEFHHNKQTKVFVESLVDLDHTVDLQNQLIQSLDQADA